jgi:hypothetical protein
MASTPRQSTARTGRVSLAEVIASGPEDQEPAPGFVASLHGERIEVTAVLRRTAVVASLSDRWADKQVVRLADLLVDPVVITWRPKAVSTGFAPRFRTRYNAEQREAMRAASDRRARADQARAAAPEPGTRPAATSPRAARLPQPDARTKPARPVAAAASPRAVTASAVTATPQPAASHVQRPALPAELRRAQQRIAELEAELKRHRAVALRVVQRVEVVVGRRAA